MSFGQEGAPFIATGEISNRVFQMPTGHTTKAMEVKLLQHKLQHQAQRVDIVPGLKTEPLTSMAKLVDADYIAVFNKEKVAIYDANNTKVEVSNGAILRGWRCNETRLWQILLTNNMMNNNMDKVLSREPPTKWLQGQPEGKETIHNMHELMTQREIIRYMHVVAGFPMKVTWMKVHYRHILVKRSMARRA